jgi:hypothetical protein
MRRPMGHRDVAGYHRGDVTTLDAAWIAALRDAPRSVRVSLWMRTVEAVQADGVSAETLAALDEVLTPWPARSRPAWAGWHADVEVTEATGYDDPGRHIFRRLRQPSSPAFRLARHVGMWFDEGVGPDELDALARWPWLSSITSVSLAMGWRPAMAVAIEGFLRAPGTRHLRELTLGLGGVTGEGLAAILEALPNELERLWIHDVRVGSSLAEALASCVAARPRLVGLAVHGCEVGAEGLRTLVERGAFDRLAELTLHGTGLGDAAARHWASRRATGCLRVLDLEEQYFDGNRGMQGEGLAALAEAGWLDGLESLALSYHWFTGEPLARVLERADLTKLQHLRLWCTGTEPGDAERLRAVRASRLPAIEHLEISYSGLGDPGERELGEALTSDRVRAWLR